MTVYSRSVDLMEAELGDELVALDPDRGLTLLFRYWKEDGALDPAVRRAFGVTLDDFPRTFPSHTRRRSGATDLVPQATLTIRGRTRSP